MAFSGKRARQQGQALARQLMQQPIGEIVEIVQPVAQIRIGLALQLGARIVLDALDRRLGGEPAADRLAQPAQPAAIMRDHPEGFQNLDMFARARFVRAVDEFVDRSAHRLDRGLQPDHLAVDVVGDEAGDDDSGLMQHDMAEAEPLGDRRAFQRKRAAQRNFGALAGDRSAIRPRRSVRRAASPSSAAPRSLLPNSCAAPDFARRARRAYCRRAKPARQGTIDRFLRPSPA